MGISATESLTAPVGLLGGTFNPIHHGHLRVALELYERLPLHEVRLLPSAQPPHREVPEVSSQMRLRMVQAAIENLPGLVVDDRELHMTGPSWTVKTLQSLRTELPRVPLYLILGMDAFLGLPQWHQWEKLLTLTHLIIIQRPGSCLPADHALSDWLQQHQAINFDSSVQQCAGSILTIELPALQVSATYIRKLLLSGRNPRYLLPDSVLALIHTHRLYQSATGN